MSEKERCKQRVFPNDRWGAFHDHPCRRYAVKDGYCKQHHPDSVAAREEASRERWEKKYENSPLRLLQKAQEEIRRLKERIKIQEAQIQDLQREGGQYADRATD